MATDKNPILAGTASRPLSRLHSVAATAEMRGKPQSWSLPPANKPARNRPVVSDGSWGETCWAPYGFPFKPIQNPLLKRLNRKYTLVVAVTGVAIVLEAWSSPTASASLQASIGNPSVWLPAFTSWFPLITYRGLPGSTGSRV